MKNSAFVAAAILSMLFVVPACTSKKQATDVAQLTAIEAYGLLRNDFAVLLDVREETETKEGMAAPARWFPMSKVGSEEWKTFVSGLPKDKQIVFYCASGGRAGKAASELAALGFKTGNMGGFSDWQKAGLPVRKP